MKGCPIPIKWTAFHCNTLNLAQKKFLDVYGNDDDNNDDDDDDDDD